MGKHSYSERQKEIALQIAFYLSKNCVSTESDRLDWIRAMELFWDNESDLNTVAYANNNGMDYIALGGWEHFSKVQQAMQNPAIPKSIRDDLNAQIVNLKRQPRPPKPPKVEQVKRVYLMKNKRNGLTKIGIARSPSARERTLQSEEPEIELLADWPGTRGSEIALHRRFLESHVRGEWFNLDEPTIASLMTEFNAELPF